MRRVKRTTRQGQRTKGSQLHPIFDKVRVFFERLRLGGQYCDKNDLLLQYAYEASVAKKQLEAKRDAGEPLGVKGQCLLRAIQRRDNAHAKRVENREHNKDYMCKIFGAKLLKP